MLNVKFNPVIEVFTQVFLFFSPRGWNFACKHPLKLYWLRRKICPEHMFNVFALVDSCFFEIVCLIEARVKFMQEQTLIFKFSPHSFLSVGANQWSTKWHFLQVSTVVQDFELLYLEENLMWCFGRCWV